MRIKTNQQLVDALLLSIGTMLIREADIRRVAKHSTDSGRRHAMINLFDPSNGFEVHLDLELGWCAALQRFLNVGDGQAGFNGVHAPLLKRLHLDLFGDYIYPVEPPAGTSRAAAFVLPPSLMWGSGEYAQNRWDGLRKLHAALLELDYDPKDNNLLRGEL